MYWPHVVAQYIRFVYVNKSVVLQWGESVAQFFLSFAYTYKKKIRFSIKMLIITDI